jgi:imidazolonepropionase-like amidohydrolase
MKEGVLSPSVRVVAVLFALVAGACQAPPSSEPVTALVGGSLIDATGAPPIQNAVLLMQGDRITAAGAREAVTVPGGATVLDVSGKTVLPGLVEGNGHAVFGGQARHAAYFAERADDWYAIGVRNLWTVLMQGITSFRDTMDPLEVMVRLREDATAGKIPAPRVFTAGTIVNYPGIDYFFSAENPELDGVAEDRVRRLRDAFILHVRDGAEGRDVIEELAAAGADFVKLSTEGGPDDVPPALSVEDLRSMVEKAHSLGLPVTTHTASVEGVVRAVDAGVDAMEHPTLVADGEVGGGGLPNELVERIAREGVYSIPMLVVREVYLTYLEQPELLDAPDRITGAPAELVSQGREWVAARLEEDPAAVERYRPAYEQGREDLRRLIQAGAPIAMGTDRGTLLNYHESWNHVRELEIYIELGMTPLEALVSATRRGAELLGMEAELGTLEVGKLADVIVVDGDPLEDIGALRRVSMVFKGGVRYR